MGISGLLQVPTDIGEIGISSLANECKYKRCHFTVVARLKTQRLYQFLKISSPLS